MNTSINSEDRGRLFAVVHVAGSQKKVTVNDIIVVESSVFPTVGTRIRLEKVSVYEIWLLVFISNESVMVKICWQKSVNFLNLLR